MAITQRRSDPHMTCGERVSDRRRCDETQAGPARSGKVRLVVSGAVPVVAIGLLTGQPFQVQVSVDVLLPLGPAGVFTGWWLVRRGRG